MGWSGRSSPGNGQQGKAWPGKGLSSDPTLRHSVSQKIYVSAAGELSVTEDREAAPNCRKEAGWLALAEKCVLEAASTRGAGRAEPK